MNKDDKMLFIKTKDEETAKLLEKENFDLVDYSNGVWTFLNDQKNQIKFNKKKITYSNILCI